MNITLTEDQIEVIRRSLQGSAARAVEQGQLAARNGFHDAAQAQAFYAKLEADCRATLAVIDAATASPDEDDEDTCRECGEDHGCCQCEEEEDEDDA